MGSGLTDAHIRWKALASRLRFYFQTWTGRILLVNFLIFILITVSSGSLWAPDGRVLAFWGAKDPVGIAHGEWWRLLSPIFLHFGIIHFFLNALALKVVGSYLEPFLGSFWFLLIYFCSGVMGNLFSSLANMSIGAGASGAIFGLIGVGLVVEQLIMHKQGLRGRRRIGPFSSMAIINLVFALIFNLIASLSENAKVGMDNAAHLGGLTGGVVLGCAMMTLRKNKLLASKTKTGVLLLIVFFASLLGGAYIPLGTPYIYQHLLKEAERTQDERKSYFFLSEALAINAADPKVHFKRGSLMILYGDSHHALPDLLFAAQFSSMEDEFELLQQTLRNRARLEDAAIVQSILEDMRKNLKKI